MWLTVYKNVLAPLVSDLFVVWLIILIYRIVEGNFVMLPEYANIDNILFNIT